MTPKQVAAKWAATIGTGRRDARATQLASAFGMSVKELLELNRQLGGQYRNGFEESDVAGLVFFVGDDLWKLVRAQDN